MIQVIFCGSTQTLMSICRYVEQKNNDSPAGLCEDYERIGAFEEPVHEIQPHFHPVLHIYYDKHSWITFTNPVVGIVVRECRADEHDVVELVAKRAVHLVQHEP